MARRFTLLALLVFAAPVLAQQPDIGAQPLYGTINLSAGFQPDPHRSEVVAGGSSRNPIGGTGCVGYLNLARPDLDLNYSAGSYPLRITVDSSTDTALLINQPDGTWICDDDSGDGSDPLVHLQNPQSGQYNIWVTTYNENAQASAVVSISESSTGTSSGATTVNAVANTNAVSRPRPNVGAQPLYGTVNLSAGFQPDPQIRNIDAGGSTPNPISGDGCRGHINVERPDLDLNYTPGQYPLYLYVRAGSDTTLLINLPDGSWVCSDDALGQDPMIRLPNPQAGQYNVWVGTYSSGATQKAAVYFSEVAPD